MRASPWMFTVLCGTLALAASGCRTTTGAGAESAALATSSAGSASDDKAKAFLAENRIVDVKIKMKSDDWYKLRTQQPKGGVCVFDFTGENYDTFFAEEVVIDGVTLRGVAAKKRSACGSLSDTKPNLAINFGKFDKNVATQGLAALGVKSLYLNNSKQDQSFVRQCLGFAMFNQAGIISPRCNYARVSVNGQYIGLYINLEPVDQVFFERTYGKPTGNLYETAGEDWDTWAIARLKARMDSFKDPEDTSGNDVTKLISTLKSDNSGDLNDLLKLVDIDQAIKYWAMEIVMLHGDGFSSNINNSFFYFGSDGKVRFMPRGIDQVLVAYRGENRVFFNKHAFVKKLSSRPQYLKKLKDQVNWYLNNTWDETKILARIDAIARVVAPHVDGYGGNNETKWSMDRLKSTVRNRKSDIASFISSTPTSNPPSNPPVADDPNSKWCPRGIDTSAKSLCNANDPNWYCLNYNGRWCVVP